MPSDDQHPPAQSNRVIRTIPRGVDPADTIPTAAAVRIGDRNLWIGNRAAAEPDHLEQMDLTPEHVVSVNRKPTGATTAHHPLDDGRVNDQSAFDAAVEATRAAYRDGGSVLVHCAAGISRSSTVIATALTVEEELDFDEGVATVKRYRRRAHPHEKLRVNARNYLATRGDREEDRQALEKLVTEIQFTGFDEESTTALLESDSKTRHQSGPELEGGENDVWR